MNLENKRKDILRKINFNDPLKRQFFRELATTTNPSPWFKNLIDEGYFKPETYPSPKEDEENEGYITIPYWLPSGFLENLAKLNCLNEDPEITELLLEIINDYINYDFAERNYRTDYVFFKVIFYLPKDKITECHINLVSKALHSNLDSTLIQSELSDIAIKRLIEYESEELLLKLLEIILDFRKKEIKYDDKFVYNEFLSIMDEFWLNKTLKDKKPSIGEFCALSASKVALRKIADILKEDENQFNYISIPTIEDHPQTLSSEDYDVQLVHFVRDMFDYLNSEGIDSDEIRECTKELAVSDNKIFKRIAIYIINLYYDKLNDLFWEWKDNPLDDIDLRHDIYRLFKYNHVKFEKDSERIDLVIKWIENQKYIHELQNEGAESDVISYQKLRWLSAFEKSQNPRIRLLIEDCKKFYTGKIEHPDFDLWTSGLITTSPKYSEKLAEMPNKKLADYLNDENKIESIFERSDLSESFIKCVSDNPGKFTNNLSFFLDVSRENQYNLLYGLLEAWRSKKTFDCSEIFDFISEIIENGELWTEKSDERDYRNLIVSVIADFIEIVTKLDNQAFDTNLLPKAERILLIIVKKTSSDLPQMHDLPTSVLNSTLGKIFSAMIIYSLRCFRVSGSFPDGIRLEFEKQLKDPPIELSLTLGRYLPNLCALDRDWTKNSIKFIFPDKIETWKPAFIGYLFYSSQIYTEIYNFLKKGNHYGRAIKTDFEDRNITIRLIQHICTFYLNGDEDLVDSNSLTLKLIQNKNPEQISFLINFILAKKPVHIDIVKKLWSTIYEEFIEEEETKKCEVVAKLSRWIELVETIDDDIFQWLLFSAKCMKSHTSMSIFIESLTKHVENTPKEVGEIFLAFEKTPDHRIEDIKKIVVTLFQKNQSEIANRICYIYWQEGNDFLRDIHEEYNP